MAENKSFLRTLDANAERWMLLGFYGMIVATIVVEVVRRFVLSYSSIWGEEIARYAFIYLAWVGVSLLLGGLLTRAFDAARPWGWVRPAACIAAVAAALVSGAAVHHRVHVWSDPVLLWRDATAKAPHSSRAWNNLGNALRIE